MNKTLVVGASPNPSRYSFMASHALIKKGIEFVPIGIRKGQIGGESIINIRERPFIDQVDTITLYIGARHQAEWYEYFLGLKPRRIIFNPGSENDEFAKMARDQGVVVEYACTLVMLNLGTY